MFHQRSDKVTVVVYDEAKKAVTFTLKRGILKRTIFSLLAIFLFLLLVIGYLVLAKRQKSFYEFDKQKREQLYLKEKEDLLAKIQLLTDENNGLLIKLNGGVEVAATVTATPTPLATVNPTVTAIAQVTVAPVSEVITPKPTTTVVPTISYATNVDIFNFVKRPIGFKNIMDQNLVKIENIQMSQSSRGVTLNFDLINNANETKITGYALVVQRSASGVHFYPANPAYINATKVPYNIGEQFGFSRMRPVIATFRTKFPGSNSFTILIFTRAGDLLLKKEIGPYEIK